MVPVSEQKGASDRTIQKTNHHDLLPEVTRILLRDALFRRLRGRMLPPGSQIDGTKGENRLLVTGNSQSEAWYRATIRAREMGLLAAPWEDDH
jgi:hypothetical protein